MERYDLSEARIYVGTYAKHNEGSLRGKWIDLSECYDQDEFMEVCHELHQDEEEPELMFQDWENIPEELIDEGHLDSNFFELRDELDRLNDTQQESFWVWLGNSNEHITQDAYSLIRGFQHSFIGSYADKLDFAVEMLREIAPDLSQFALTYFDYDKYTNELFCYDYWFENGYVFRNE